MTDNDVLFSFVAEIGLRRKSDGTHHLAFGDAVFDILQANPGLMEGAAAAALRRMAEEETPDNAAILSAAAWLLDQFAERGVDAFRNERGAAQTPPIQQRELPDGPLLDRDAHEALFSLVAEIGLRQRSDGTYHLTFGDAVFDILQANPGLMEGAATTALRRMAEEETPDNAAILSAAAWLLDQFAERGVEAFRNERRAEETAPIQQREFPDHPLLDEGANAEAAKFLALLNPWELDQGVLESLVLGINALIRARPSWTALLILSGYHLSRAGKAKTDEWMKALEYSRVLADAFSPEQHLFFWAQSTTSMGLALNLGNAQRAQSDCGQKARICFLSVLERIPVPDQPDRKEFEHIWLEAMEGLGDNYRQSGEAGLAIEEAIACYREVLEKCPSIPADRRGGLSGKIGLCLIHRSGAGFSDLAEAIKCFEFALNEGPSDSEFYNQTLLYAANAHRRIGGSDRGRHLETAVFLSQEALRRLTPAKDLALYVLAINELAEATAQSLKGTPKDNIAEAVHLYQDAEMHFRALGASDIVRWMQHLAIHLRMLSRYTDKEKNQEAALRLYLSAIETIDKDDAESWSFFNALGNLYLDREQGDPTENKELAIAHLTEAVERAQRIAPEPAAHATVNLCQALLGRAENVDKVLNLLRTSLNYLVPGGVAHATANITMAQAMFDRIDGDLAENVECAIEYLETALRTMTPDAHPFESAMARCVLAKGWTLRKCGLPAKNLERAIFVGEEAAVALVGLGLPAWPALKQVMAALTERKNLGIDSPEDIERALKCLDAFRDTHPIIEPQEERIHALNELHGALLLEQSFGEGRGEALDNSIERLERLAYTWPSSRDPMIWAEIMGGLGHLYNARLSGSIADNKERAIACCEQALEIYDTKRFPVEAASALTHQGNALLERIKGDSVENIERAIKCFKRANLIRPRRLGLSVWARTMTSLGYAYTLRAIGERNSNKAIQCLTVAAKVLSDLGETVPCALTKINLGKAYARRARNSEKANYKRAPTARSDLKRARDATQDALSVLDPRHHTHLRVLALQNLGSLNTELYELDDKTGLESAIAAFREALTLIPKETYPTLRIAILSGISQVMILKEEYEGVCQNLEAVFSDPGPGLPPDMHVKLLRQYALALTRTGRDDKARNALRLAIEEAERNFADAELTEQMTYAVGQLGVELAQLCIAVRDIAGAIEALERGAAMGLRKALSLDSVWLSSLDPGVRGEIEAARDATVRARREVSSLAESTEAGDDDLTRALTHLLIARQQLSTTLDKYGLSARLFSRMTEIVAVLPDRATMAWLVPARDGGFALLVDGGTYPNPRLVFLPEATSYTVIDLMRTWMGAHARTVDREVENEVDRDVATADMDAALRPILLELHRLVMGPLEAALPLPDPEHPAELILIPHGALAILPLHAASAPDGRCTLDIRVVSYTPSGHAYRVARDRLKLLRGTAEIDAAGRGGNLFGVYDPDAGPALERLPLARKREMPALSTVFAASGRKANSLMGGNAIIRRVVAQAAEAGYLHFACHGGFNSIYPEACGLYLADGILTVSEIAHSLKLSRCRFAALSGCVTGVINVLFASEEFFGLPAAFLQAGSLGVAATFWSAVDRAAAPIMERFYTGHLVAGKAPAAALRDAILDLRTAARSSNALPETRIFDSPSVWAVWAYHGA